MRKKIITMLILSTVAFTACSNDSNSKQADMVVPTTTTTTATITTATTEQETVAEYVFLKIQMSHNVKKCLMSNMHL